MLSFIPNTHIISIITPIIIDIRTIIVLGTFEAFNGTDAPCIIVNAGVFSCILSSAFVLVVELMHSSCILIANRFPYLPMLLGMILAKHRYLHLQKKYIFA